MGTVLVVDDEKALREGLCRALQSAGHVALSASGVTEARAVIGQHSVDCVLLDVRLRDGDGIDFLEELRAGLAPEVPVVMATAYGDSERTIRAMRLGAFDYATKPFDLTALLAMVARAVRQRELDAGVEKTTPPVSDADTLVGTSPAMLQVWKLIGRAAATDSPVLITGETGTGKERVARAIHAHSSRAAAPFVAVNLAALPETLLESELFGHEKGAFTGASQRKPGRLELAAGGTLFLDEIGDLDAGLQTRLLRVLQERQWERVGGVDTLTLRARVMAATHRPVRPGSAGVTLREDLYYRLAVIEVDLPPLRARRSDVPLLVAHALRGTRARAVSESAMRELQDHHWPGNVRELLHTVTRAAVMCSGEVIDTPDLPDNLTLPQNPESSRSQSADPYAGMTLKSAVAALEKSMIVSALARSNGNRTEAARILGIARPQLYAKLDEHGLSTRRE